MILAKNFWKILGITALTLLVVGIFFGRTSDRRASPEFGDLIATRDGHLLAARRVHPYGVARVARDGITEHWWRGEWDGTSIRGARLSVAGGVIVLPLMELPDGVHARELVFEALNWETGASVWRWERPASQRGDCSNIETIPRASGVTFIRFHDLEMDTSYLFAVDLNGTVIWNVAYEHDSIKNMVATDDHVVIQLCSSLRALHAQTGAVLSSWDARRSLMFRQGDDFLFVDETRSSPAPYPVDAWIAVDAKRLSERVVFFKPSDFSWVKGVFRIDRARGAQPQWFVVFGGGLAHQEHSGSIVSWVTDGGTIGGQGERWRWQSPDNSSVMTRGYSMMGVMGDPSPWGPFAGRHVPLVLRWMDDTPTSLRWIDADTLVMRPDEGPSGVAKLQGITQLDDGYLLHDTEGGYTLIQGGEEQRRSTIVDWSPYLAFIVR